MFEDKEEAPLSVRERLKAAVRGGRALAHLRTSWPRDYIRDYGVVNTRVSHTYPPPPQGIEEGDRHWVIEALMAQALPPPLGDRLAALREGRRGAGVPAVTPAKRRRAEAEPAPAPPRRPAPAATATTPSPSPHPHPRSAHTLLRPSAPPPRPALPAWLEAAGVEPHRLPPPSPLPHAPRPSASPPGDPSGGRPPAPSPLLPATLHFGGRGCVRGEGSLEGLPCVAEIIHLCVYYSNRSMVNVPPSPPPAPPPPLPTSPPPWERAYLTGCRWTPPRSCSSTPWRGSTGSSTW